MSHVLVVGAGHVGLPCAVGLAAAGARVTVVEVDPARRAALERGEVPIDEPGLGPLPAGLGFRGDVDASGADVVVVAVPTPSGALDAWREATDRVGATARDGALVLVKSTVPAGATDELAARFPRLRVVANPEFLRAGRALADLRSPARLVLGGAPGDVAEAVALWRGVVGPAVPVVATTRVTAELVKLASNAMLAARVAFANELTDHACGVGADVDQLWAGVTADPRIGGSHLRPSPGFGGPCLPKDVDWLLTGARGLRLVAAARDANEARVAATVAHLAARAPVAVWGTGFRPGSSGAGGSVPARIVAELVARRVAVRAWDPASGGSSAAVVEGAGVLFVGSAIGDDDPSSLRPRAREALDPAGLLPPTFTATGWSVRRAPDPTP